MDQLSFNSWFTHVYGQHRTGRNHEVSCPSNFHKVPPDTTSRCRLSVTSMPSLPPKWYFAHHQFLNPSQNWFQVLGSSLILAKMANANTGRVVRSNILLVFTGNRNLFLNTSKMDRAVRHSIFQYTTAKLSSKSLAQMALQFHCYIYCCAHGFAYIFHRFWLCDASCGEKISPKNSVFKG
jgi:hypothetical protein